MLLEGFAELMKKRGYERLTIQKFARSDRRGSRDLLRSL
jgi:hypothetical protein